jgi:hypothetical protein
VKRWLGGLEPAWTLLSYDSFAALRALPSPKTGPIRLATGLTREELEQSACFPRCIAPPGCCVIGHRLENNGDGQSRPDDRG